MSGYDHGSYHGSEYNGPPAKRKRKRQIINDIKKQVAFYFSDSNLSKDKYLQELIESDPLGYVSLDTLETFGRITEMRCSRCLLVKSISFHPDLALSSDNTRVRRISPVNYDHCADDRTIYIENVPPKMDHARLERALAKYGGISHISLPRFKINKEFKGFGFIEFNTVEEAMKALKGLGWEDEPEESADEKPDDKPLAPLDILSPPNSLAIASETFANAAHELSLTPDTESELFKDAKDDQQKKKRRRRRSSICGLESLKTPDGPKKRDPLLLVNSHKEPLPVPLAHGSARKRKRTSLETVSPVGINKVRRVLSISLSESDKTDMPPECEPKKQPLDTSDAELKKQLQIVKAKRRKKKKQKLKKKCELQDIRVFPKLKWMELKTVYKQLQKQQISAIKRDLGMKSRDARKLIKLSGAGGDSDDSIRNLFRESVVSLHRLEDQSESVFVRFTTNPESYKTSSLPSHMHIQEPSQQESHIIKEQSSFAAAKRYQDDEGKRRKLRGYAKVIKKCSAKDQTSQDVA